MFLEYPITHWHFKPVRKNLTQRGFTGLYSHGTIEPLKKTS